MFKSGEESTHCWFVVLGWEVDWFEVQSSRGWCVVREKVAKVLQNNYIKQLNTAVVYLYLANHN